MTESIKCEVCQETSAEGDVYCNKCGNILPKDNWDSRIQHERKGQESPSEFSYVPEEKEKKKWFKPPKRKRPAYHPLEWLFWIGWALFVFFGFIFVGIYWLLKEIFYYVLWICYWGPPREMKKRR